MREHAAAAANEPLPRTDETDPHVPSNSSAVPVRLPKPGEPNPLRLQVVRPWQPDDIDLTTWATSYTATCRKIFQEILAAAHTDTTMRHAIAAAITSTMIEDHDDHLLWFNLRNQSMFNPRLQKHVAAIDKMLTQCTHDVIDQYLQLTGSDTTVPVEASRATLDTLFERSLASVAAGDHAAATETLYTALHEALTSCFPNT